MPTRQERRWELSGRVNRDELKENNGDVAPVAPVLQAIRDGRGEDILARLTIHPFKGGQVSLEELNAVHILFKAAAGDSVLLVGPEPVFHALAPHRELTFGQKRLNANLQEFHIPQEIPLWSRGRLPACPVGRPTGRQGRGAQNLAVASRAQQHLQQFEINGPAGTRHRVVFAVLLKSIFIAICVNEEVDELLSGCPGGSVERKRVRQTLGWKFYQRRKFDFWQAPGTAAVYKVLYS